MRALLWTVTARRTSRLAAVGAVIIALCGPVIAAQSIRPADADAQAQTLFREVMSPFCPGLTLADCPSPQAFEMRGAITRRLENGEPREAIVDELVATYGASILSDPSDTPIGRVVWGVPFVLSVLAAGALALFLKRVTRSGEETAAPADDAPAARRRLDEQLSALD